MVAIFAITAVLLHAASVLLVAWYLYYRQVVSRPVPPRGGALVSLLGAPVVVWGVLVYEYRLARRRRRRRNE